MARFLGPEKYGIYIYAIALAELVMLFWSQGLKEVVIQKIKEQGLENTDTSVAAYQLMALGNTFLYGILIAVVFYFEMSDTVKLLSIICGIGIWFRSFEAFELWFHSSLKIRVTVKIQLFSQALYMTANVLLIIYESNLIWFGVTYAFQLIVSGVGFLFVFMKNMKFQIFKPLGSIQRSLLRLGLFMIVAKLLLTSSFLIDRFFIEQMLGIEWVGTYSASMKMVVTWSFISTAICYSFIPLLTENKGKKEFRENTLKMFGICISISFLLIIVFSIFAKTLVIFVFGEAYLNSVAVFKILVYSMPFLFINEGIKAWLIIMKRTKYYVISMLLTTLLCIILNIFLIEMIGITGAAIAFVISWGTGGLLIFFFIKETREMAIIISKSVLYPIQLLNKKT